MGNFAWAMAVQPLAQAFLAAVHRMVVGIAGHRDAGLLQRGERRRWGEEDVRLGLRLRARSGRQGRLEVDHAQLGSREQGRDGRAQGSGRFSVQAAPTVPSKCTSPPKARVTGLPLPFQSGLSGEWAGNAWVVCAVTGAGGVAFLPPPGEEDHVDQKQEDKDPDRCELVGAAGGPCVRPRRHYGTRPSPSSAEARNGPRWCALSESSDVSGWPSCPTVGGRCPPTGRSTRRPGRCRRRRSWRGSRRRPRRRRSRDRARRPPRRRPDRRRGRGRGGGGSAPRLRRVCW